jgi:hypothetical protein
VNVELYTLTSSTIQTLYDAAWRAYDEAVVGECATIKAIIKSLRLEYAAQTGKNIRTGYWPTATGRIARDQNNDRELERVGGE